MNRRERRHRGRPFCPIKKLIETLQIPHRRHLYLINPARDRRVSLCASGKGSLTLEAAMVLPLLLFAVTALLYLFAFTSAQARAYRTLTERAQTLAVTVGQASKEDPYIQLYDYQTAALPFSSVFRGRRPAVQKVIVRAWVGYTGESFSGGSSEEMVYMTPEGEVYHRDRDCTYLLLAIRTIDFEQAEDMRNLSGGRYAPCEYCVRGARPRGTVYITDYGTSYHNVRECQGLKRTIMTVPLSKVAGVRCCSRCGGG